MLQTLIIGVGTWVASNLPWFIAQLGVPNEAGPGVVPPSVKVAFAIGAFVFMASILVTILTTPEYPPEDLQRVHPSCQLELAGLDPAGVTEKPGEDREADILLHQARTGEDLRHLPQRRALGDGHDRRPLGSRRPGRKGINGEPGGDQQAAAAKEKGSRSDCP